MGMFWFVCFLVWISDSTGHFIFHRQMSSPCNYFTNILKRSLLIIILCIYEAQNHHPHNHYCQLLSVIREGSCPEYPEILYLQGSALCCEQTLTHPVPFLQTQLPAMPTIEFSPLQSWNSGVRWTISTLSEAPTKATDYTSQGLQYLKDLTK
uniref:MICOS complex subunit MIC13 n=1 Tax=Salarias fasciatus TaxID=181472 RepID=A0A672HNG5_SALFA